MDPKQAIAKVETYTTAEVMGASKQEYRGLLIVTKVFDVSEMETEISKDKWAKIQAGDYRQPAPATNQERSNKMKQCKKELLRELQKEAVDLGANAVVGIKMDDTVIPNSVKMKFEMYGTAVYFTRSPLVQLAK